MTAKKRKRSGGLLWPWLGGVIQAGRSDDGADRPELASLIAVATVRALHADPDGGSCFPSQQTLSAMAGVKRETVRRVDAWLVDQALMRPVRKRKGNVTEYRLTTPQVDPGQDQLTSDSLAPDRTNQGPEVGPQVGTLVGPVQDHDLRPPTVREEDGGLVDGGGLAPAPPPSADPPSESQVKAATRSARNLLDATGHDVNRPEVIDALAATMARDDWPAVVVEHRATVILAKSNGSNPAAFLVRGLDRLTRKQLTAWERYAVAEHWVNAALIALERLIGEDACEEVDRRAGLLWLERQVCELFGLDWDSFDGLTVDLVRAASVDNQKRAATLGESAVTAVRKHLQAFKENQT